MTVGVARPLMTVSLEALGLHENFYRDLKRG